MKKGNLLRLTGIVLMAALLWCATCALPASASHVHEWEQTDVAYPTCTSDGYYVLKCKVCGQTKTEITDHAFGHSWVLIEDVPVTCYSDGYYVQQCENCGEKITTTIPKLDHEWEQISIEEYSTCQTAGYAVQQCIYCGTKRQVALPLATHSWGEWTVVKEPSDNTAGFRQRVCTVCGSIDSASFYPDGTLYPGCNLTEGVVSLQSMLIDLGYLNGTADGSYGPKTQAAVIAFQTEKGLKSDGIAWPETVDAVMADWNTAMGIVTENPTVILPYCRQNGSRYEMCENHRILFLAESIMISAAKTDEERLEAKSYASELWIAELESLCDKLSQSVSEEGEQSVVDSAKAFEESLAAELEALSSLSEEKKLDLTLDSLKRECMRICELLNTVHEEVGGE